MMNSSHQTRAGSSSSSSMSTKRAHNSHHRNKPRTSVPTGATPSQTRGDDGDDLKECTKFAEMPLSTPTIEGLTKAKYVTMTDIQKAAIPLALQGRDILGAAKTGSGKTLAFLIPLLELLHKKEWTRMDGLGALIITPTRELALQIFEVLRTIGKRHNFSAGLIIGGTTTFKEEQAVIGKMVILIATPGRLLQHMDETPLFYTDSLQLLVLDEADRMLSMGFADTMNSIIEHLPKKRQTLLFSATQTKCVQDLARLGLKDPEYVAVHEQAEHTTPEKLIQNYLVCELQDKLDLLFSFLRSHVKSKTIVFLTSRKQVRFMTEVFSKLRAISGATILGMSSQTGQTKRTEIFNQFCAKRWAILFATDIAARGLDFPHVDWVLQPDCPDTVETYIHRAGRTARNISSGKALMFVMPSELPFLHALEKKKIPIEPLRVNPEKTLTIRPQLSAMLAHDPELKFLAQKYFATYIRSLVLRTRLNNSIWNPNGAQPPSPAQIFEQLSVKDFAHRLGLSLVPRIRISGAVISNFVDGEARKQPAQQRPPLSNASNQEPHRAELDEPDNGLVESGHLDQIQSEEDEDEASDEDNEDAVIDEEGSKVLEKLRGLRHIDEQDNDSDEDEEVKEDDSYREESDGNDVDEQHPTDQQPEEQQNRHHDGSDDDDDDDEFGAKSKKPTKTRVERMLQKKDHRPGFAQPQLAFSEDTSQQNDEFFSFKRVDHALEEDESANLRDIEFAAKKAKKISSAPQVNTRIIFADTGNRLTPFQAVVEQLNTDNIQEKQQQYQSHVHRLVQERDTEDKPLYQERVRSIHRKRKERQQQQQLVLTDDVETEPKRPRSAL